MHTRPICAKLCLGTLQVRVRLAQKTVPEFTLIKAFGIGF